MFDFSCFLKQKISDDFLDDFGKIYEKFRATTVDFCRQDWVTSPAHRPCHTAGFYFSKSWQDRGLAGLPLVAVRKIVTFDK